MVKQRNDKKVFHFAGWPGCAILCPIATLRQNERLTFHFFSVNNMFKPALLSQKLTLFVFFLQVGLAVQFVSNCHSSSKREAYVRELRRFIPVDIYGKCGEFKCAKEKGWQCYKEAEAKYKFYLAFENSV